MKLVSQFRAGIKRDLITHHVIESILQARVEKKRGKQLIMVRALFKSSRTLLIAVPSEI